ncbi:transcriptional regulator [Paenibacillus sp. J31TS4]|uniref:MerR family transcriptional regulator n=1 Tax=Paenibacillus sp. J31TS4 TaxID=2807195 RepID=UPI001B0F93F0|nr:MerR family transcriptional regulator [Paenibacillus sp. J31TS4]GIP36778.1 transcriptional regulator [Paenibacillus sp. J31TS4]
MKIGELARRTGVSIRSLRYYEEQGLLKPERGDNGYREYSVLAEEQVRTIQFYLGLGLSTEQIAGFLQCVLIHKEAFCSEVLPVYEKKLAEIEEQLALLTAIRSNLMERIAYIRAESTEEEER